MSSVVDHASDTRELYRQVVDLIASRTLYEHGRLLPDCHLEGELGIDSVILESILADAATRFEIDVSRAQGIATVQDLVDAIGDALADRVEPIRQVPVGTALSEEPALETVLTIAMRHTQYRRDQLDADADVEADLGIDSVVMASITGDAVRSLGLAERLAASAGATTLRALAKELSEHLPARSLIPARLDDSSAPSPAPSAPSRELSAATDAVWDGRSMKDFMEVRDNDLFAKARQFAGFRRRREDEHLYWYGMPLHSRCQNRAVIHDEQTGRTREYLMFASNNYLGLANHPKVLDAICDATRVYGATNTGCRLIGGTNVLHKELERRLAAFKQRPACIVFPGGYSANLGAISALVKGYDTLVVDKLNHMSIVDGARLSGGVRRIFQHNDMADLERVLSRTRTADAGTLIAVDGVFSMHGDICDLPEIVRLAERYGARVLVDDAHATGVLGERGSGTAEHFGLKGQVDLELGTMSKTLAGMGGFVVGDEEVIDYLRFYADPYVFAATIPAGVAAGLIAALDVIEAEPERIRTLWSNIRRLRARLEEAGFDLENSRSAILPIVIGDERTALRMGRAVRERGLFCQTVVFPGVPLGDARLRVSVTSEHTAADLDLAADVFIEAGREVGVLDSAGESGSRG